VSEPAIAVRSLSYVYPDGTAALRDVDLSVASSEVVGLLGPNGSGKSTLLHHLNGILPESGGAGAAVMICGRPITASNAHEIRRDVGLVFQDPDDQLFCASVLEDVRFGPEQLGLPEAETAARAAEALRAVGLADLALRPPHHLSVGEKRRACLAGVLACRPRVLVLDEPTSGLDPRGRRELITLLRGLHATMLIASHDLEFVVEVCPRSVLLDGGRVVADGDTRTLLGDGNLMLAHGLEKPHILQHHHPH